MNLELLDPFGRQVPDRIDSTLELPAQLHFRSSTDGKQQQQQQQQQSEQNRSSTTAAAADHDEWKAAYHVAFNRRGTYVAIGYGSGTVAIHNVTSRSLAALYRNEDLEASPSNHGVGISNVSWSRRSRTLLVGSAGDATVKLIDTTHPYGPDEANAALLMVERDSTEEGGGGGDANPSPREIQSREERIVHHSFDHTKNTSFTDVDQRFEFMKRTLHLEPIHVISMGKTVPGQPYHQGEIPYEKRGLCKYPAFSFTFPCKVGASLQLHPRITTAGLAVLDDGSLVLFWEHPNVWVEMADDYPNHPQPIVIPVWKSKETQITCAAFDPHGDRDLNNMVAGDRIFAATNDGRILGFNIRGLLEILTNHTHEDRLLPSFIQPSFNISITGAAAAWHLLVSRNGKFFVVNSADGALRLFSTKECWQKPNEIQKPTWVFQDVVTKVKFASSDLSGDGEYVVGSANGSDNKYELYIWNTSTGALMDKLTGPSVQAYSVAWHPTRAFVAVATSDGLLDIWGPRINWTNFAPDFQALPMNVEYVEGEDELDVDKDGKFFVDQESTQRSEENENSVVDVCTIEPVPVFASDSEKEEEVFAFETKLSNLLLGRRGTKQMAMED